MSNSSVNAKSLIADQVAKVLVEPLEAKSVVLEAGPKVFDSSEPLRIPTLTDGFDPAWVGENELIPEDDAAFGELALMPTERKSIKSITRVSNELIRMAKNGVDTVLKARLVKDVANKLDTALLIGDGADNTVTGILNQPGVQSGTLDTADPDSLLDAIALANAAEVNPNRWFISGADYAALSKLKDADGKYLLQTMGTIDGTMTRTLFGVPVTVTNKLTAGQGALVDMSEVAVVRDINPTVKLLDERYAEYDQFGIRVVTRYDLGLLHPEGVVVFGTPEA